MSKPLVIGYYTENTPYEQEADVLQLSLESCGYEYDIRGVANLGSWQKNTQYKAHLIRSMMSEHPDRPLLYLDVDAIMISPPVILDDLDVDIAAVYFCDTSELLSGTVYFGPTDKAKEVVDKWILLNHKYPDKLPNGRDAWDQRTLDMAIKRVPGVRFHELPQGYTWIAELTQKRMPEVQPVICHTRGAKRFKRKINSGQYGPA